MANTDRRRLVGALGEDLARRHLEARGYELVDANFRTRAGELDLVVADERRLVFCEVKTRVVARPSRGVEPLGALGGAAEQSPKRGMSREAAPSGERGSSGQRGCSRQPPPSDELGPFAAIGRRKRSRVRLMAREWLAARPRDGLRRAELRFDAIGIELDPQGRLISLEHLEGAF